MVLLWKPIFAVSAVVVVASAQYNGQGSRGSMGSFRSGLKGRSRGSIVDFQFPISNGSGGYGQQKQKSTQQVSSQQEVGFEIGRFDEMPDSGNYGQRLSAMQKPQIMGQIIEQQQPQDFDEQISEQPQSQFRGSKYRGGKGIRHRQISEQQEFMPQSQLLSQGQDDMFGQPMEQLRPGDAMVGENRYKKSDFSSQQFQQELPQINFPRSSTYLHFKNGQQFQEQQLQQEFEPRQQLGQPMNKGNRKEVFSALRGQQPLFGNNGNFVGQEPIMVNIGNRKGSYNSGGRTFSQGPIQFDQQLEIADDLGGEQISLQQQQLMTGSKGEGGGIGGGITSSRGSYQTQQQQFEDVNDLGGEQSQKQRFSSKNFGGQSTYGGVRGSGSGTGNNFEIPNAGFEQEQFQQQIITGIGKGSRKRGRGRKLKKSRAKQGENFNDNSQQQNVGEQMQKLSVQTRHQISFKDYQNQLNYLPQIIEVNANSIPMNLVFRSASSPLNVQQVHQPQIPNLSQTTYSQDAPHVLKHTVKKPIFQMIKEYIVPLRKITQQINPVQEQVITSVATAQNFAPAPLQAVQAPISQVPLSIHKAAQLGVSIPIPISAVEAPLPINVASPISTEPAVSQGYQLNLQHNIPQNNNAYQTEELSLAQVPAIDSYPIEESFSEPIQAPASISQPVVEVQQVPYQESNIVASSGPVQLPDMIPVNNDLINMYQKMAQFSPSDIMVPVFEQIPHVQETLPISTPNETEAFAEQISEKNSSKY